MWSQLSAMADAAKSSVLVYAELLAEIPKPRRGHACRPLLQMNVWGRCVSLALFACGMYLAWTWFLAFLFLQVLAVVRVSHFRGRYVSSSSFRAMERKPRHHEDSPSCSSTPGPLKHIAEELREKCGFSKDEKTPLPRKRSWLERGIGRKTLEFVKVHGSLVPKALRRGDKPGHLDMDHVYLDWSDFVIAYHMIFPSGALLQMIGLGKMVVRKWLHRQGLVSAEPCDHAREVGRLCLESMQVIHFVDFTDGEQQIATFAWNNFETVDSNYELSVAPFLRIDIDLTAKRMKDAFLGTRKLTAQEAYILLAFNGVSHAHPKIHALANWGVNPQSSQPFFRWMSVVTVMYNYFGFSTFVRIAAFWRAVGFLKFDYARFGDCVRLGVEEGINPHSNIKKLMYHSPAVHFIVSMRNCFMQLFDQYRDEFLGVDGEPLFAGTILHSLDHDMYAENVKDILWLDSSHPEFGFMAEAAQMTRVAFVPELPLLPFNRKFYNATHPFYRKVYEHAVTVNPWFADRMDTCIIR